MSNVDFARGWDTIVAARQGLVNSGLRVAFDRGLLPRELRFDFDFDIFGVTIRAQIDGVLGPMEVFAGTGRDIEVAIPVVRAMIRGANGFNVPLENFTAVATINLTFVQSPITPASGTNFDLRLDFTSPNAFVGIRIEGLQPDLERQATGIGIALTDYLRRETAGKTYTVATVNLGAIELDFPELVPNLADYTFLTSGSDASRNTLALTLLTQGRSTRGLSSLLAGTIPDTKGAAVIISNPLFIGGFVRRAIAEGFGVSLDSIAIEGNPAVLRNNGDLVLRNIEREPVLKMLLVEIRNDELVINLRVEVEVSPGIRLIYKVESGYILRVSGSSTNQQIELQETRFNSSKSVKMEWWVWVAGGAAAVIALPIVGIIFAGIIGGIGVAIVAIIQAIVRSNAPNLRGSALAAAARPIRWNFSDVFQIESLSLPLPLQAGGQIPFAAGTPESVSEETAVPVAVGA